MPYTKISYSFIFCLSLAVMNVGILNVVYADQNANNALLANNPAIITGKVTDVIVSSGVTFVEVDVSKQKVWAAGVGAASIEKGGKVSFSTEMPMHNYHSKNLNRDFSLIYFVREFKGPDQPLAVYGLAGEMNAGESIKPEVAKFLSQTREVKVGDYLRQATLDSLQGEKKKFSDFKGKPLMINVWASWCGPCRAEMGSLEELAKRYNGKAFNIIGISTDDYRDRAMGLIRQTGISFENFIDHKLMLEKMLGARAIPLTILVDAKGRVLQKVRGARNWNSPEMIGAIGQVFQITLKQ